MPSLTSSRGLISQPSELTRPDGALSVADNVIIDSDNIVEQRRGLAEYGQATLDNSYVKQILTYKNTIFRHYSTKLEYDSDGNGNFVAFDGSYSEVVSGLRIKFAELNGNFYFTSNDGVKKISATDKNQFTANAGYITAAGGIKATGIESKLVPSESGFLPAQSKVAYRMVWGTKDTNNVLILGSPSARSVLSNTSKDINIGESFLVSVLSYILINNSQYFTFDTPGNKYAAFFQTTGTVTPPSDAAIVNRQLIPVDIQGLTTNDQVAARIGTSLAAISDITIEVAGSDVTISNIDGGDVLDADQGDLSLTALTVSKVFDGQTSSGIAATGLLSFQIPTKITTDYFYQIYRTGIATVDVSQQLSDIDPGEEFQLVYEAAVTTDDLTLGEISVEDITPETFRQGSAYLYTNPVTGGGILSANEAPPVAQDIALFKGSLFFSNTTELHRKQFNLLSVSDFVSGTSKLTIADSNTFRQYTFVGTTELTDITVLAKSATIENSYILLNSANNEREYKVWFDKGVAPVEPTVDGTIAIRVALQTYPDTTAGSIQAFIDAFDGIDDFSVVDLLAMSGDQLRVSCTNNGPTSDPSHSLTPSGWTFSVFQQGTGENKAANEVFLSGLASVGQSVEETAKSIERVINADTLSNVNAYYLSGLDDLPGIILLESRSLSNPQFFVGISDSILSTKFNPNLPVVNTVTDTAITGNLITTSAAHGLIAGDEVILNDGTFHKGKYKVATAPSPTTLTLTGLTVLINQSSLTGVIFKTFVSSDNAINPNRLYFSKTNQPESVPLVNFIDVGPKDKPIRRILSLRDSLVVLKDDGVYILSGAVAPNFSIRLVDSSAILTAPDSAVNLNNLIYMLSTQGVVTASETGVSVISRNIEDLITQVTNSKFNYKSIAVGVSYESDRSYILWLPEKIADTTGTQAYRYNTFTRTWSRWTKAATCGLVSPNDDKLYLGSGDTRRFVLKERKNFERQDYADRDFTRSFLDTSFADLENVVISSLTDIAIGDVIVQSQYLTITKFNRILKKLDRDESSYLSNNYHSTLAASVGSNMATKISDLVNKLNVDLASVPYTITLPSMVNTPTAHLSDFNLVIQELNNSSSGTSYKDYSELDSLLSFEGVITSLDQRKSSVSINYVDNYIEGDFQVFKAIKTIVQYAPQHFGSPETLKQINQGTFIFDQNNFYGGRISYSSDRAADFTGVNFVSPGPGAWGNYVWSDVTWGGEGSEYTVRTLIPMDKQRCRYIHIKYEHTTALEKWRLLGVSLEPRLISPRAYR